MTAQLIPVFTGTISNEITLLCNARDLHEFLNVRRDFSTWINDRISEYEFAANLDYIVFSPNLGKTPGRKKKDYHLTLDTAKELAMVERNDKGRQVRRYFIECEKRLIQQPVQQPPAEPLSAKDMNNLTRLVWMMTGSMKFEPAWNSAVWYCLRSATGRPSPQPFSVNDLPALEQECIRILKITSAFNAAVYDFEKGVISKVVRRRQALEPLLADMQQRLKDLHQQEAQGLLMLDRLHEHGLQSLVNRQ